MRVKMFFVVGKFPTGKIILTKCFFLGKNENSKDLNWNLDWRQDTFPLPTNRCFSKFWRHNVYFRDQVQQQMCGGTHNITKLVITFLYASVVI